MEKSTQIYTTITYFFVYIYKMVSKYKKITKKSLKKKHGKGIKIFLKKKRKKGKKEARNR